MNRFSALIDEVADSQKYPLSQVLMKAKVLAYNLRSRKFRRWVDAELGGYGDPAELPSYRVIQGVLHGNFAGAMRTLEHVTLHSVVLPENIRRLVETQNVTDSVAAIEALANASKDPGQVLPGSVLQLFRQRGPKVPGMVLNEVIMRVPRHVFEGILSAIRGRLLDFLLELREKYPDLGSDDDAPAKIDERVVDAVAESRFYEGCTIIEGASMRDVYATGQAGAVGPNAKADNNTFVQLLREAIGDVSLSQLATELETLRLKLIAESKGAEQDQAVAAVAVAEDAAKKGDAKGVMTRLKSVGKWGLDVATSIGTAVAAKAIEQSLKLKG